VDAFELETPKTKALIETVSTLLSATGASNVEGAGTSSSSRGVPSGVIIVVAERSDGVWRAARNLDDVHVVTPNGLNLLDLLRLPRLILSEGAVQQLTRTLTLDLAPLTSEVTP
jgi:ribosomal protein L4